MADSILLISNILLISENKPYAELQKSAIGYPETLQVSIVLFHKQVLAFQKQHCINMTLVQEKFLLKQLPPHSFSPLFKPSFIYLLSASTFHLHPKCGFSQTHSLKPTRRNFSNLFDQQLAYHGVLQGNHTMYNSTQLQIHPS